ncbi:hypothetical protein LguiA_018309 [Lonicera macranthoides]
MSSSTEEEELMQMVIDFIESEPPISHTYSKPINLSRNPIFLSLQETLERGSVIESEVLERILMYLKDMEGFDDQILNNNDNNNIKEWIVLRLKMDDYEASLCKSSWVSTFGRPFTQVSTLGHPSGDYEYIDVMMKDESETRLIIDLDFRAQFELARPTQTYTELKNALPSIFVGSEGKLNEIIYLLCSAAKQSLQEKGLHIPPWRKANYMQSKWLSHNYKKISFSHIKEAPIL